MRIVLILIVFLNFNLQAENSPTVALTAGSEFSPVQLLDGQSITENQTVIPTMAWVTEDQLQPKINSYVPPKISGSGSNDKTILISLLLIGIALFYITNKTRSNKLKTEVADVTSLDFEEEEKVDLKKEVWNLMATQPVVETETFRENIIATKPLSYSKHIYNCSEGKLIIEQANQHPNTEESVWLNDLPAPNGKYKIGLLLSVEVINSKISKVIS